MNEMPLIGLGTYKLNGKECTKVIRQALEMGYQHIDTALSYENHEAIGKALKGFDREKVFITSKFFLDSPDVKEVGRVVKRVLKELDTDYLDLLLIHWPNRELPLNAILEAIMAQPQVRHAGVSNYTIHHLQDAYDAGLKVEYNQVEFHPHLYQKKLLDFCKKHGTQLVAYRPFGQLKGPLLEEKVICEIAEAKGKTPSQIILRWIIQKGVHAIPKASSEQHLKENLSVFDFSLSEKESARIDALNQDKRYCATDWAEFDY